MVCLVSKSLGSIQNMNIGFVVKLGLNRSVFLIQKSELNRHCCSLASDKKDVEFIRKKEYPLIIFSIVFHLIFINLSSFS